MGGPCARGGAERGRRDLDAQAACRGTELEREAGLTPEGRSLGFGSRAPLLARAGILSRVGDAFYSGLV